MQHDPSSHYHCSCHEEVGCHHHAHEEQNKNLGRVLVSVLFLLADALFIYYIKPSWYTETVHLCWCIVAILPVGLPVAKEVLVLIFRHGDVFNEMVLMFFATVGAFCIGEYFEGGMLMILFGVSMYLEEKAGSRAKRSIRDLIDSRPDKVKRFRNDEIEEVAPQQCVVGDRLYLIPGDRVSFDGELLSESATLDTAALTGESLPVELTRGAEIQAGSIVQARPVEMKITKPYNRSTIARILELVEEAAGHKTATERFIRRFSRIYTPIVFAIALMVLLVPFVVGLFSSTYDFVFKESFYNALVVLVTSCPCALIISVPLSYYMGVGAASRHGLLFKGTLFLEILPRIRHFLFDKTGTLTEGSFSVAEETFMIAESDHALLRSLVLTLERQSSHPIARAITAYLETRGVSSDTETVPPTEYPGMGIRSCTLGDVEVLIGNRRLMEKFGVEMRDLSVPQGGETVVFVAYGGHLSASYCLKDRLKSTAKETISSLRNRGLKVSLLSGDRISAVKAAAKELGIEDAHGELLPQDKMALTERFSRENKVAFVGDGLNDAPVMVLCDLSFAMGEIAGDATVEAADIVIGSDDPYKIVKAIKIARKTHLIVLENIIFALGMKAIVMLLGIFGWGALVMAIFADVGVTLLVILNALRLLRYRA